MVMIVGARPLTLTGLSCRLLVRVGIGGLSGDKSTFFVGDSRPGLSAVSSRSSVVKTKGRFSLKIFRTFFENVYFEITVTGSLTDFHLITRKAMGLLDTEENVKW